MSLSAVHDTAGRERIPEGLPLTWLAGATLVLAVWGAALSTFNTFYSWRKERPKMRATRSPEFARGGAGLGPPRSKLAIANVGQRPVLVTELRIELPDGRRPSIDAVLHAYLASEKLPKRLQDGEEVSVVVHHFDLAEALRSRDWGFKGVITITPIWIGSIGRPYRGYPWRFDVDSGFDPAPA